jgi:hypothetical protein
MAREAGISQATVRVALTVRPISGGKGWAIGDALDRCPPTRDGLVVTRGIGAATERRKP